MPPSLLPQMADTAEIVAFARTVPGLEVVALVPNLKGAKSAIKAGVDKMSIPFSMSETRRFSVHKDALQCWTRSLRSRRLLPPSRKVGALILKLGYPRRSDAPWKARLPKIRWSGLPSRLLLQAWRKSAFRHDRICQPRAGSQSGPRGKGRSRHRPVEYVAPAQYARAGLANVLAGLEGITTFNSSMGGIGGCPLPQNGQYRDRVVFMLEAMGLHTGIDIARLAEVRRIIADALPGEPLRLHTRSWRPIGLGDCLMTTSADAPMPLQGIRVIEFTHMVMGPGRDAGIAWRRMSGACGAGGWRQHSPPAGIGGGILPDVQPPRCLDLKSSDGLTVARDLVAGADVLIENFPAGALDRLGLGYDAVSEINPRLIYCSEKIPRAL